MKKFNIQTSTITLNKELISIFSLELKSIKYILYSGLSIDESLISANDFEKMEFNEEIQILPKKKFNDAKLSITKKNNINQLLYLGNPVYALKDSKNIIINDSQLTMITSFGKLYGHNNTTTAKSLFESNLVNDILNKNKTTLLENQSLDIIKCEKDNEVTEEKLESIEVSNEIIVDQKSEVVEEESESEYQDEIIEEDSNKIQEIVLEKTVEMIEESNNTEVIEKNIKTLEKSNEIIIEEDKNIEEDKIIKKDDLNNDSNNECKNDSKIEYIENIPIEFKQIKEPVINSDITKQPTELFSLENILSDFNKLFNISDTKEAFQKKDSEIIKKDMQPVSESTVIKEQQKIEKQKEQETQRIKQEIEQKQQKQQKQNIYNIYTLRINYNNIFYKISTIKLKETPDLNFSNLYKAPIFDCNVINNINLSFELETFNSSYLISIFNQKYLIIKNDNIVIITNLYTRQSNVTKNNDNFKLGNYDYMLYNGTLLLSMLNKKIFDNNYGTSYTVYVPRTLL